MLAQTQIFFSGKYSQHTFKRTLEIQDGIHKVNVGVFGFVGMYVSVCVCEMGEQLHRFGFVC